MEDKKAVEDYITVAAKSATEKRIRSVILDAYYLNSNDKVRLLKDIDDSEDD